MSIFTASRTKNTEEENDKGNEFRPDKVSEYMTEIKGRSFVFEDVSEYVENSPVSWAGAYKAQWQRNRYE